MSTNWLKKDLLRFIHKTYKLKKLFPYIGQTERNLITRLNNHNIDSPLRQETKVAKHQVDNPVHKIDIDIVQYQVFQIIHKNV